MSYSDSDWGGMINEVTCQSHKILSFILLEEFFLGRLEHLRNEGDWNEMIGQTQRLRVMNKLFFSIWCVNKLECMMMAFGMVTL